MNARNPRHVRFDALPFAIKGERIRFLHARLVLPLHRPRSLNSSFFLAPSFSIPIRFVVVVVVVVFLFPSLTNHHDVDEQAEEEPDPEREEVVDKHQCAGERGAH